MDTSKSMTEIAFESGFNDYSVFYKSFKQTVGVAPLETVGVAPLEYRKKL